VNKEKFLTINEIFFSLQGESTRLGIPTIFIRLTGCPMRCHYCDTAYAFDDGKKMSFENIIEHIKSYKSNFITLTGGEPLVQKEAYAFLEVLCDMDYQVSLETGGAESIKDVDERVKIILDIKTPGSGELDNYLWENLDHLKSMDEIKLVITSHDDYLWAKQTIKDKKLISKYEILFSPSYEDMDVKNLAQWILDDALPVRLQLQQHKIIWGQKKGV
jgi:7-carboxy-7-deazaguanine synthase